MKLSSVGGSRSFSTAGTEGKRIDFGANKRKLRRFEIRPFCDKMRPFCTISVRSFWKTHPDIYIYIYIHTNQNMTTVVGRYLNHTSSFRNQSQKNAIELSKYVRSLKNNSIDHSIKWQIIARAKPYDSATKRCN